MTNSNGGILAARSPLGVAQAVRTSGTPSSAVIAFLISNFCGLPVAVIGNSVDEANVARHLVMGDLALAESRDPVFRVRDWPGLSTMKAQTSSPKR